MSTSYDEFIHALSELESGEFLEEVADRLGEKIKELIDNGFRTNSTPYGEQWVRKGSYPWPILEKTGAMRAGFHVATNAAGVKATNPVEYARFQNDGTRYVHANAMLPDAGRGLGDWQEPLREVARAVFNSKLKGGG
jgi:hypothetical protein